MLSPDLWSFEVELQNTLQNLYDSSYEPAHIVLEVMDSSPAQGLADVRNKLVAAILEIRGGEDIPLAAKSHHYCDLLNYRFVQSLSQERAADLLGISARHLRRTQGKAIHALALWLWNRANLPAPAGLPAPTETESAPPLSNILPDQTSSWGDAVLREIEALNARSPGTTATLDKVVLKSVEMMKYLFKDHNMQVELDAIAPDQEVSIHPTVLRQVLLFIVEQIVQTGYDGVLRIAVHGGQEAAHILLRISQTNALNLPGIPRLNEFMGVLGGKVEMNVGEQSSSIDLALPKKQKIKILVIDDNMELVSLYHRFLANTCYEISHLASGSDLLEQIKRIQPGVIVMDVMLPGVDGWDLLLDIHNHQPPLAIPVIVCSIIGSEQIAHSLGASGYLPKPVERKTLLQMLDKVCGLSIPEN